MKYLKNFKEINEESLYGELSRLNPKRYKNDVKVSSLFEEIKQDFIKNGKDLRKVSIRNSKDKNKFFDDGKLSIGRFDNLTYLFGKFHYVNNNVYSGNDYPGKRKIEISYTPFEILFKKNSLEKMFNVGRIRPLKITVTDTKIIKNPIYNPNITRNLGFRNQPTEREREMMVRLKEEKDEYKISPDIGGKIIKYFIDEYNKQYPQLKKSKYKGSMSIDDIERGVPPTVEYIDFFNKYGDEIICDVRYGDDVQKLKKLLYNMTKEESDEYCKNKKNELYKDYNTEREKTKLEKREKIINNIKKSEFNKYIKDFDIRLYWDYFNVNVRITQDNYDFFKKVEDDFGEMLVDIDNKSLGYKIRESHSDWGDKLWFIDFIIYNNNYLDENGEPFR